MRHQRYATRMTTSKLHPPGQSTATKPASFGVLLINLGTPSAPTPQAIRRYLAEFLSDKRVIEASRWIWWPVLYGLILPTRPRRLAKAYQKIWTKFGSPLAVETQALAVALQEQMRLQYPQQNPVVDYAMCYGEPSIATAYQNLRKRGVQRVFVVPLYPQYSATTTAAAIDLLNATLARERYLPELRIVTDYHAFPAYIEALALSVEHHRKQHGSAQKLLLSFHGLPQSYVDAGDPYAEHCFATARLLAKRLGLSADSWSLSFQSRFGPKAWLKPYTSELLAEWAGAGIHTVDVICPGFAVDCLETLEEITLQNQEHFQAQGGKQLRYIPALNGSVAHVALHTALIAERCSDWLNATPVTP